MKQNLAGQATLSPHWAVVAQFRAETEVEQARFKERLNVSRMFELDRGKSPVGLVRARTPFVGRRQQLDWLERCLAETLAGNPRAVLIQGEAGIGKTRLLKELRSIVLRRGMHVCYGRCYEDLTLPYLPFVESFLAYLEQVPEAVQRTLGPDLELINGLLRRTETVAPLAISSLSTQSSQDTLRLFLAVSRVLIRLARQQPLLLIIDDLHWTDRPSLDLLSHIVFAVAEAAVREPVPLLLVGTYRPVGPEERLARAIARLQREDICQSWELPGFTEPEVTEFIQSLGLTHPSHQLVATLSEATQGNPLFIQETLHQLVKSDALRERAGQVVTTLAASDLWLPEQITAAVTSRLHTLSDGCRKVLTLAALLGERFSLQILSAVSGVDEDELLDWLEEGIRQHHLLSEGHLFQFAHPLIRQVFCSGLSVVRRQRLHHQIAQTLERLYAPNLEDHILEIAHHLVSAGPAAEAGKLVPYARRAGDQAVRASAWEEAARYYEAALAADELPQQLSAPERAELHYRAGIARYRDLDVGPCLAHYEKAIEAYQLTGDVRGLARALMERTRALSTIASVSIGTLLDLQPLADVLNKLRDVEPGLCGRGWATMATAYWMARQPERAEEVAQHALELGQRIQDDALCAQSSCELGLAQMQSLRLQEALENYQSALVYARRVDDPWLQGRPLQRLPLVLTLLGRLDEAETLARQACEAAHESQDWSYYSLALAVLETVAVAKGDFAAAESYAQRAMVMVHRSHYPWGGLIALSVLACTRSLRGAWSAAEDALNLLVEPGRVFAEPGPAVQAIAQGYHQLLQAHSQPPEAIREQLTATPWQATDHAHPDIFSLASFCALVEVGDLVADPRLAERSYRALSLAAEQGVMFSPLWLFLLPRVLGVAATLNHWWDDAEAHFQAAIDLATRVGARPELGRSYLDYARLLAARGGESDRHRASELGEQAHSLFTALGMHPFCQRAAHLIQTLQASRSRTRTASQELNQTTRHSDTSRSGALQIPPCPPLQKGGQVALGQCDHFSAQIPPCPPLQKGGSVQRGGISARSDTNGPWFDLDPSQPQPESSLFRQEGEYWTLAYQGTVCRVRDARGLRYLAYLLRHPHQQIHVLDLAASTADLQEEDLTGAAGARNTMVLAELGVRVSRLGDAGAILDPQARAAYKHRLEELREELAEVRALDDTARAAHIEQERDFLIQEIASAVGLGGRERRAAAPAERARVNVTRAIKAALEKLATYHPILRHHLKATIYTGLFCSYTPDLNLSNFWQF